MLFQDEPIPSDHFFSLLELQRKSDQMPWKDVDDIKETWNDDDLPPVFPPDEFLSRLELHRKADGNAEKQKNPSTPILTRSSSRKSAPPKKYEAEKIQQRKNKVAKKRKSDQLMNDVWISAAKEMCPISPTLLEVNNFLRDITDDDYGTLLDMDEIRNRGKASPMPWLAQTWDIPEAVEACLNTTRAPPINHTRGKWLPSGNITRKSSEIEYFCTTCSRRLASKRLYEQHMKSGLHWRRQLDENDLEFDGRSSRQLASGEKLMQHPFKQGVEVKNGCNACRKRIKRGKIGKHLVSYYHFRRCNLLNPFQRSQILENIHSIVLQSPYQCSPCKFYCNTPTQFLHHWSTVTHPSSALKEFWCSFCKFSCHSSEVMRKHLVGDVHDQVLKAINGSMPVVIRHRHMIHCNICQKDCKLEKRKEKHMKLEHGIISGPVVRFKCLSCNFVAFSRKGLQNHGSRKHKNAVTAIANYCSVCKKEFPDKVSARLHRTSKQHKYTVLRAKNKKLLPRKCKKCGHVSATPSDHTDHVVEAHKDYFLCPKCGRTFGASQLLSHHTMRDKCTFPAMLTKWCDVPKWKCSDCFFVCNLESDYLFHCALHDDNNKKEGFLTCPKCKKMYLKKCLRNHLRKHTGELNIKCEACFKKFPSVKLLNNHKIHCSTIIRPVVDLDKYQCELCPYLAKTRTLLNRHLMTHGDKREFSCPHCPFNAKLLDHLKRHLTCHKESKPFKCPHCNFSCKLLENLRKHVMKTGLHPGKKLYQCKLCSFGTNDTKDFGVHLTKNHPESCEPNDRATFWGLYQP